MRTIHKFELEILGCQTIEIAGLVRIISALNQREKLVIYAEVYPPGAKRKVEFAIIGTGHRMPDEANWAFVNSVSMSDGDLIWHIYQRTIG